MRPETTTPIIAVAHPNIALIKYWGKRDYGLNLPAVGSISVTLDALTTTTKVVFDEHITNDAFVLNGRIMTGAALTKVQTMAQQFRDATGTKRFLKIDSENNFPTAAGLASSASGFAALVVAMDHAWQTSFHTGQLSCLARLGSGSAPRSLYGGFVQMRKGEQPDGTDAVAAPLLALDEWPLEVVVAITSEQQKPILSTQGMESTRLTSPYYQNWVDTQEADLQLATRAIDNRDFERLAIVSEHSCLKMHGLMMSANPGLLYWNAATMACLHEIRAMRASGTGVFFTIDAGPQIKAICLPGCAEPVARSLQSISGVSRVITTGLGRGARLLTT